MSTHPHTLENLAESIYEEIVSANFRDLERSDEQVVYAIACERAQVEYNDLVHDYINGLWNTIRLTASVQCMRITALHMIYLWSLLMSKTFTISLQNREHGFTHSSQFGIHFMPEYNDCTYDQLVEDYADIVIDRMDFQELYEFARETVIDRLENMTEKGLIDHINELECKETADEIISTHYGINPPDCYITNWWKSNSQRIRSAWFSTALRDMFKAMTITIWSKRLTRSSRS